jgi:hypothetical protein
MMHRQPAAGRGPLQLLISEEFLKIVRQIDPPDLAVVVRAGGFDVGVPDALGRKAFVEAAHAPDGGVVVAAAEPDELVVFVGLRDVGQRGRDVGRRPAAVAASSAWLTATRPLECAQARSSGGSRTSGGCA